MGDIAAASNEQARGIAEVNKAVNQMDKVTQQTAANAEESAGAAEELTAQAEGMKGHVQTLIKLVGGEAKGNRQVTAKRPAKVRTLKTLNASSTRTAGRKPMAAAAKEFRSKQVIPMDDEDFDQL